MFIQIEQIWIELDRVHAKQKCAMRFGGGAGREWNGEQLQGNMFNDVFFWVACMHIRLKICEFLAEYYDYFANFWLPWENVSRNLFTSHKSLFFRESRKKRDEQRPQSE